MSNNDYLKQGPSLWAKVAEGPLIIKYNNPWLRLVAFDASVMAAMFFIWFGLIGVSTLSILASGVICLVPFASSLRFLLGERRIGMLLSEVNAGFIAVGCPVDRIIIPWDVVDTKAKHLPVNNKYLTIPIQNDRVGEILFQTQDGKTPWDLKEYRRFICSIKYNPACSWVEIWTKPNGYMFDLLAIIYPMLMTYVQASLIDTTITTAQQTAAADS